MEGLEDREERGRGSGSGRDRDRGKEEMMWEGVERGGGGR
jgi:hypothetical protein